MASLLGEGVTWEPDHTGAAEKQVKGWGAAASRVIGLVWAHQDQAGMRIPADTCVFIQPRAGNRRANTGQL